MAPMKRAAPLAALVLLLVTAPVAADVSAAGGAQPILKVIPLIQELKAKTEMVGMTNQRLYDQRQCWCEETLRNTTQAIVRGKAEVEQLQETIFRLSGDLGAHQADIKHLQKSIAENQAAQREAEQVRTKESLEYGSERSETENGIGALEAAIKALAGAGTGKKGAGFLEAGPQAQLLSVAADVKSALQGSSAWRVASAEDIRALRNFAENPEEAVASPTSRVSAMQVGENPFGDYAPQSTRIQGIMKGLYDSLAAELEKDNAGEADKQKGFEEFMQLKEAELNTLQKTLQNQVTDRARKAKLNAESKNRRDLTKEQVEADEDFFEKTKDSCRTTAENWAEQLRLRTEFLQGINQAIAILTAPDATATFMNASLTFIQLPAARQARAGPHAPQPDSVLAQVAAKAKEGGHFDKVIVMINHLIERIRKEEQDDIAHRDRCQNSVGKNTQDIADLEHGQLRAQGQITRMKDAETDLLGQLAQLEQDIEVTEHEMNKRLQLRNEEQEEFTQALLDDANAIALLQAAIVSLTKFYKQNGFPMTLVQKSTKLDPNFVTYSEQSDQAGRIVSVLQMLVDDLKMEIKTGRQDDAKAEAQYKADRKALATVLRKQKESQVAANAELADVQAKIIATTNSKADGAANLAEENNLKDTLSNDCSWVKTHFASRRAKRKAELQGLAEAKALLAGAEKGDFDEMALSGGQLGLPE